jgi:opacity protein-like surface antigen
MSSIGWSLASIVAVLCIAGGAAAAEPAPTAAPDRVPDLTGRHYFFVSGGWFNPHENPQFRDPNGHYGFALGFGSRHSRHFAWEIEFFADHQRVDRPFTPPPTLFATSSGRASIETLGLAGNIRLLYPLGRFEPYVGAGIGLYHTELKIDQGFLAGSVTRSDTGPGVQLLAGVEHVFGEGGNVVGLQYRRLKLDASLGPEIVGKVDAGGDFVFIMFRRHF